MPNINWNIVTPCLWSGGAGAIVGAVALSQVFGFISPSSADKLVKRESEKAVVAALAPGCAADFRALSDAKQRMAQLIANKDNYRAKEAFPENLITLPGESYVDYDLVRSCTALLVKPAESAALQN